MSRVSGLLLERPWWPVALFVATSFAFWSPLQRADLWAYDLMAPVADPPTELVVVAVDEASIAELGQWPWPREMHARLLARLHEAGAAAAGFAVLFSEAQPPTRNGRGIADGDAVLAEAFASFGRAVLPAVPVEAAPADVGSPYATGRVGGERGLVELGPLPRFRAATRLAHADLEIDVDGVVRRMHLLAGAREPLPSLALALADAEAEAEADRPGLSARSVPSLDRGTAWDEGDDASWKRDREVLLPRMRETAPVWSYASALRSEAFADAVRGMPVLVGITARGLGPELPLAGAGGHQALPVVYAHAHAYQAIAAGTLVVPASRALAALSSLLLLAAMLSLLPRRGGRRQQALVAIAPFVPVALSAALLHAAGIWWGPVPALAGLLAAGATWHALRLSEAVQAFRRTHGNVVATLDSIGDAVFQLDADGRILYLNAAARRLAVRAEPSGLALDEALALEPESGTRLLSMIQRCRARRGVVRNSGQLRFKREGMPARALSVTVTPLAADRRQPDSVVVTLIDLTDRILNTQRLHHAATHDQLTGLANRLLLRDRVGRALAAGSAERPARVAILFIALNRFKRINEGLGDRMGDEVLRITAQRLLAGCRADDTVARWGADEFVVALDGIDDKAEIVGTTTRIVDALSREITLDGVQVSCSCSVGIAVVPDDGNEADELFAKADAAMHRAKARAGASYEFYSDEPGRWTRDRLALERELRQGMARGEFELHYQPKIRIGDEGLVGFEALMRWRRSDGELMPPGEFIGLAEESGLIVELGAWAIREAIDELARWRSTGCRPVPVAVNVSGRQLQDHGIVETIRDALAAHAIAPSLLTLEITENTAMADPELASTLTAELAEMGVRVSIDDFGTGYSSLSLLRRVSIAEVKIDRSFVEGMVGSPDDAAIVRATIALAHELGLQVVAEGVELRGQLAFLAEHDCDTVQGFLFGRAVPGNAACRMLAGDRQVPIPA